MRIQTVEKKKKREKNTQKQLPPKTLSDMNLRFQPYESSYKIYKKTVNWIKRYVLERKFDFSNFETAKKAAKEVTFGRIKLRIQSIKKISSKDREYFNRLLKTFDKNGAKYSLENYLEKCHPVRITITDGNHKQTGYTSLNGTMTTHEKGGMLRNQENYKFEKIWDYKRLLAEIYVDNLLYEDIEKDITGYRLKIVKHMRGFGSELTNIGQMPSLKGFQKDYLQIAKSMKPKMRHWHENHWLDSYQSSFYLIGRMNERTREYALLPLLLKNGWATEEKVYKQRKETAKVYETNQNIRKDIRNVMEDNAFLNCYGFVELHNSIDLNAFYILEKNFEELREKIYIPVCKEYSFRIKKLGQHGAGGLHYKGEVKAILIDTQNLSAYAHELGHQIDLVCGTEGKYESKGRPFSPVSHLYEEKVKEQIASLPKNDRFLKRWYGNTAYNRAYYLDKEEIFARCFEIYIYEKGIRQTSLAKEELSPIIYPVDSTLRKQIVSYFDALLPRPSELP